MSINENATSYDEIRGTASPTASMNGSLSLPNAIHGKSAYEVAVINGFEGTEEEWLKTLEGGKGERGSLVFNSMTTPPIASNGTINGVSYKYYNSITSVIHNSDAAEVKRGDMVLNANYLYPVVYVDDTNAYFKDRINVEGSTTITDEDIENAINAYLAENPIETGATEEEAAQIEQNKTDIAKNSEDIAEVAGEIERIDGEVTTNAENISANTAAIEKNKTDISENAQAISDTNTRVDNLSSAMQDNSDKLAEHDTSISNFNNIAQDVEEIVLPTLQTLERDVAELKQNGGGSGTGITSIRIEEV